MKILNSQFVCSQRTASRPGSQRVATLDAQSQQFSLGLAGVLRTGTVRAPAGLCRHVKSGLLTVMLALVLGHCGAFAADAPEATTYQIRNVKHQDLLRPRDANNATGTPIVLYSAQPWKCMTWRLQPAGESGFHLKNLFTGKTFCSGTDTNAATPAVTQIPLAKNGGESPAWQFTKLDDGHYKIADSKSGKVLTAKKGAGESEPKIVIAPWENQDEQKWILEKMDPKQLTM